mmetsp:Transcript_151605/g.486475  ORF Transcript_151605/g.486475 Transcript_151605/m.486475 type:complete len:230 (-) Transcript_151605:29-718(-)
MAADGADDRGRRQRRAARRSLLVGEAPEDAAALVEAEAEVLAEAALAERLLVERTVRSGGPGRFERSQYRRQARRSPAAGPGQEETMVPRRGISGREAIGGLGVGKPLTSFKLLVWGTSASAAIDGAITQACRMQASLCRRCREVILQLRALAGAHSGGPLLLAPRRVRARKQCLGTDLQRQGRPLLRRLLPPLLRPGCAPNSLCPLIVNNNRHSIKAEAGRRAFHRAA